MNLNLNHGLLEPGFKTQSTAFIGIKNYLFEMKVDTDWFDAQVVIIFYNSCTDLK